MMFTMSAAFSLFAFARISPLAAAMNAARLSFVGSMFVGVSPFVWMKRSGQSLR